MRELKKVALYFVESPLQYMAARCIAENFEKGARQVLVWYLPGVTPVVKKEHWDAVSYMPWPRKEPLPGLFGRHRRLRENIKLVADLVGKCDEVHIHSSVFQTEAINYFLRALPRLCGARTMRARLIPDGTGSAHRYILPGWQVAWQYFRKFRKLIAPELDYWCFSGDRFGSDAEFCDRIYVLNGFPHDYQAEKVVELPPLVGRFDAHLDSLAPPRALVISQPLVSFGLMSKADHDVVTEQIHRWLTAQGVKTIHYKGHPKDNDFEFFKDGDKVLELDEPLEEYLTHTYYNYVVGANSTALIFARQIYPETTRVIGFGWDKFQHRTEIEKKSLRAIFTQANIELM